MKISVHITFFVKKNLNKEIKKLTKVCRNFLSLSKKTKIFIHTNKKIKFNKKNMHFIYHNLSAEDPFKLSWKCRPLMLRQKDEYDYFIYSEDDIIFNRKNFIYWLKFKNMCKKNRLNLGFLRTEVSNKDKKLVSTKKNENISIDLSK